MPVTIVPVNDAPTAQSLTLSVVAGGTVSGTVAASDVDGDPLTVSIQQGPSRGACTITDAATGAFSYTAGSSSGTDSVVLSISDGTLTATATVTIQISQAPGSGDRCGSGVAGLFLVVALAMLGLRRRR